MSLTFKRNYTIILLVIIIPSLLIIFLGKQRVIAYTNENRGTESTSTSSGYDYLNNVQLFDDSILHSVQVIMADDDYDKMISTYQETGIKDYFHADVIIDGVRIDNIGIRLKGNASLRSALGGNMRMDGVGDGLMGQRPQVMPEDGMQIPDQFQRPELNQQNQEKGVFQPPTGIDRQQREMPENFQFPARDDFQGMNPSNQMDGEIKIPLMIKFDEFVSGQTYQGFTAIAIRTYGTSYDEAMLQEPITNRIANLVGLPATQTVYTGFKMNDGEEKLFVVSELVNQVFLDKNFDNNTGVLYKAELGSTLNYKGDDPSSYTGSFTQQTRKNDADLLPLISFMKFLEEADESTLEAELPEWLDVDSFALYLAVNAMVVNTDSMIGMNNNFYLYYDDVSSQFTVLIWDANESFGKLGGSATYDITLSEVETGFPGGGGAGRRGMGGGQNVLISRFLGNEKFRSLYEAKLHLVYQQIFQGDLLEKMVNQYADMIHSYQTESNLVNLDAYDQAVDEFLNFINQRKEYLNSNFYE